MHTTSYQILASSAPVSSVSSQFFDEDAAFAVSRHASMDPLHTEGNWVLDVEFDGVTEQFAIEPNREPHGPVAFKTFSLSDKDSVFISHNDLKVIDTHDRKSDILNPKTQPRTAPHSNKCCR